MKKLFLFVAMFLMASTFGYAQEWVGVNRSTPVEIQETLVSSSEEEIVVDVKVGGFFQKSVETPNGKQMVISGDKMAAMLTKGAPELPMYPISMIIGDRAEMEVSIVKSNYTDFENVEVAPSKGNFSRKINPADVEFVYGEMYEQDAFYPASQATLDSPYILRDFRAQNLMVYPYAYNPVTKTLRVYTDLRISVKKVSDNGENQKVSRRGNEIKLNPESKASYDRRFINFGKQSKYDFLVDEGEMLIICVDEYMDAVQPLVEWKNISGRPTTMVGVSETGTGDAMKTYVQNYYNQHPNFTYLLLVGEYNNLPPQAMGYNVSSDNYFGMLEGDDYYEEVLVGRLSVISVQDATNQVNKILHYEKNLDETATWLSRGSGVSANEGSGHFEEVDYMHVDFIRDTLLHYTYTEVSQHYGGINNPTPATMIADFDQGVGIINYTNHGSPDGWAVADFSNTHVHQLTNDQKLPFIWSVACNNGQLDYQECFAEAWMRATNESTGEPTGAVGGMFSWISQPWVPPMYGQDEMNAILAEWHPGYKHTLGGASLNGNMYVLDMCPGDYGETHNSWLLFGDPSMMVRTEAPESMNLTVSPSTLIIGMTSLTVNADADFGIATLSKDGEVLASSYIENGTAELEFEALTNVGTLQLVVIGYNKETEIKDIDVIPSEGAYLVYDAHDINQADGQMDYNDNINLSLDVKNAGSDVANNVTVTLSSDSEYVAFTDNTATIASLAGDATITLDKEFTFMVTPDVPNGTKIEFKVSCSDGTDAWETKFKIVAYAPVFELKNISIETDTEDGGVNPGDELTLYVDMKNVGNSEAFNVIPEVLASSKDIEISETTMLTTSFPAGCEFTYRAQITVASNVINGSVYELLCSAFSDYTFLTSKYQLTIGSITEDFETGDFSAYEWQFEDDEWVIDNQNAYEGNYCVKSNSIGHSEETRMKLQVEVLESGEISFYKKTSTEEGFDELFFYIDNLEKGRWSGEADWEQFSFPITQGTHKLEWIYTKDYMTSSGQDCAWIDMITFPPVTVVSALNPVANLEAEVQGTSVTLSWDALSGADEYFIRREGELVSSQTATSFTETLEDGIYTYNVVARNGNRYSMPAFVTVWVGGVDIVEVECNKVIVYPNPTSGVLNVEIDTNFDATVYNHQGQIVLKSYNNNEQIDMSSLVSGIYFVQIKTNKNVTVEKVIVK